MKTFILPIIFCFSFLNLYSQQYFESNIPFQQDEYWWGGVVAYGSRMPYLKPVKEFNIALENYNNQVVPFFLSNKGRYIWSDKPFYFEIADNTLKLKSEYEQIEIRQNGKTLKEAYLAAVHNYFPPTGLLPDQLFFTMPQYNTWIELMYNQNEKDILAYAQSIIDNNLPTGVLMIDDNWQKYYGNFDFRPEKFQDPKGLIQKLHNMGFKVMLWVCPFVSADSHEYREAAAKGYLIKNKESKSPAIIHWWNGQSACYDLTNPEAFNYFVNTLKKMQDKYGVDGFKFDAGDNSFYDHRFIDSYKKDAISTDHTLAWAKISLEFPFNEYRACWKMGNQPLVQRLGDKDYSWNAIQLLIPEMIAAGLLGYSYTCPDMIGGGQYGAFLNIKDNEFDQKLIVRSAQIHALMPMMQFSVAPWRILDNEHMDIVQNMAKLHEKFGDYIINCAKESAKTGEPIVRHMEYTFPNEGFAECKDQFMLGEKYMVAPVVTENDIRTIKLPKGKWRDDTGKNYKGGQTFTVEIPISRLVYFEKIQ